MAPSHILKTTQGADSQSASDSRRRDAKLKCTKFLKRRKTIIKKADLLHKDCRAKVYIYVELDHKSWVYDSAPTDTSFPPSKSDQVCRENSA